MAETRTSRTFELITEAPPDADIIFVSTDEVGTPGALNQYVMRTLGYREPAMPRRSDLLPGYTVRNAGAKTLVFVVTVGSEPTRYLLEKNLDAALSVALSFDGNSIWVPLMGTGAGGLSHLQSLQTTLAVLRRHLSSLSSNARIIISLPPALSNAEYEALHAEAYGSQKSNIPFQHSLGQDVLRILDACSVLDNFRKQPATEISTTLFFLSITVADRLRWVETDPIPQTIKDFACYVREFKGADYQQIWGDYFRVTIDDAVKRYIPDSPEQIEPTQALIRWMDRAIAYARSQSRLIATLDDVVRVSPDLQDGNVRKVIAKLGGDAERFSVSIKKFFGERQENKDPVTRRMLNDQATLIDRLGFDRFVDAMAQFILSEETTGPMSISVEAPWGFGKSSLMAQLRQRLDPERDSPAKNKKSVASFRRARDVLLRDREYTSKWAGIYADQPSLKASTWTVWFNAWKYESSEQVWSGLMDAVIKEISARLSPAERELFLFRLNLSRVDDGAVRKRIHERLASLAWRTFVGALAGLGIAGLSLKALGFGSTSLSAAGAVWMSVSAGLYFLRRKKLMDEPANFSLSEFFRMPDYQKGAGVLHQIQADLDNVLKLGAELHRAAGGGRFRIAIFVDDLDRCAPGKVASVVEGISTFLASDRPEFFFVIGMDSQIVAAALDYAHKDLRNHLPHLYRGVPLGWRFMDKFIQLPFTIPARHHEFAERYISSMSDPHALESAKKSPAEDRPRDTQAGPEQGSNAESITSSATLRKNETAAADEASLRAQVSQTVVAENTDVRTVVNEVMTYSQCSPREIKRVFNLVRFVLHLRVSRIISGNTVPPLRTYASWIVLGLRWPELVRWLEWGPGHLPELENGELKTTLARRLRIFESLAASFNFEDWGKEIRSKLYLSDEVQWTNDRSLYEFLLRESSLRPELRLSTATETGLF